MSVRAKVRVSKIMRKPIKVGVRTYATYTNCRILFMSIFSFYATCVNFTKTSFYLKTRFFPIQPLKSILKSENQKKIRKITHIVFFNLKNLVLGRLAQNP